AVLGTITHGNRVLRIGFSKLSGSGNFCLRSCRRGHEAHECACNEHSTHKPIPPLEISGGPAENCLQPMPICSQLSTFQLRNSGITAARPVFTSSENTYQSLGG